MNEETVKEICQAIHDATPPATRAMKLPNPVALLDSSILLLEEVNVTYLPAIIEVLKTLKTFTPG
jgi:hypothetical protein